MRLFLRELETVKDEIGHRGAGWPKVPAALSNRLTRAEPFLRKRGIEIVGRREGHERTRIIYITDEEREEGREEDVREEEINQSTELVEEDEVCASEYSSAPLD
ncbi:MAG TPA: hypothetical protein VF913_17740 [Xanthobacteraceae bacterium]